MNKHNGKSLFSILNTNVAIWSAVAVLLIIKFSMDFGSSEEDAKSAGFDSVEQMEFFNELGFDSMADVETYGNQVSSEEFLSACKGVADNIYTQNCLGKFGIWSAILKDTNRYGVRLKIVPDCSKEYRYNFDVDAVNIGSDYLHGREGTCEKVLLRISDKNVSTPDVVYIAALSTVNKSVVDSLESKQRAKEQARERVAQQKRAADLERHRNDADWLARWHKVDANGHCQRPVEDLAKYDFEWTDGWTEQKFSRYLARVVAPYVLTVVGDKIKFQNGFGAWQHMTYYCDYHVKEKRVLRAYTG